ncbi:nonribosomal peptide synthetase 12 [Dendrothele bispora CBS 962.96]|uniref:Nonribosomal peptide synthetase 12 n=1 Tax=Dendrothele bispora (strain CBS 962.96) TaxID=1314807 RepID=A0A4S8LDK4_DENBC|nr:nonribosomal peptide synthetase 12 [Dendrothele bispora CBS 962.96]
MDSLQTLTEEDRILFYRYGFGDVVQPAFECVHHAFAAHAASHPSSIAVENFQETITYAELDRLSNCLARRLRQLGVMRKTRVCVVVERSIFMVVAILSVLKAGGAYVPLDGNVVSSKSLEHVLRDSNAVCILTLRKFAHRINCSSPVLFLEDADCQCTGGSSCQQPEDHSRGDDSLYVIYTSGTTGVPKGVEVKHSNVTKHGTRVSQLMNIGFDMAAWEILGSLCNGATLCLRGKTSREWRAVMKTVDVVIATPSMLLPHEPSDYPNIKVVAVAGEACPQALADKWALRCNFWNSCGPTEVTIVNTMQLHIPGDSVNIGRPTPNNNVYILDDELKPLPIGQPGLMYGGGMCVSAGYVNLPEKTHERYKSDPFVSDRQAVMFNTGDIGRWRSDGTLEHLGRIDDQVKVKGFRVELDGVASAMETCPQVRAAVALLIDDTLWGFVTPENALVEDVIAATSKVQPYYAVPSRVLSLDKFPETSNGKRDKKALRQLAVESLEKEKSVSIPESLQISKTVQELSEKVKTWIELPPPVYQKSDAIHNIHNVPALTAAALPGLPVVLSSNSMVSESSSLTDSTEKALPWDGYLDDPLPDKNQGRKVRNLRHQIFTLYRRLFGVVFVVNMSIFIAIIVQGSTVPQLGKIVIANLCCAILMRQDYVINAFFNVFCAVPPSWPLTIRRVCARVYHIGGLHSGCAISGVIWLILFTGQATKEFAEGGQVSIPTLSVTYVVMLFLFAIALFAFPSFRIKHHDTFERVHRFSGWTACLLVWAQVVLLTNDYRTPEESLGHALATSASFWLLVVLTASIVLPWLRLRKVPVRSEVLSNHAVRLYFDYVTPVPGTFTRISDNPLMEWHGFATVKNFSEGKGYSLVVSKAGDWTTKQIMNPPTHLWVRGIPTCGVLRIVPLFRRLVFVATGSGIGPCAPCILERRVPIRLLWTSPDVRKTFGDKLVDSILEASPDAVIYDTRKHGKPDMVRLTLRLVQEFNAEAVCVISNQKLTRKVVYGMVSRGIPAFGAIWDS